MLAGGTPSTATRWLRVRIWRSGGPSRARPPAPSTNRSAGRVALIAAP